MLGNLGQYWSRAVAGITRSFGRAPGLRTQLVQLEQQILSLANEMQTLSGKQERMRAEGEQNRTSRRLVNSYHSFSQIYLSTHSSQP